MAGPTEFIPTSSLGDALVILGAAGIVIPLFARFRITPVVGFILAGVLAGPFGLGQLSSEHPWLSYVTISDPGRLTPFAEFGIILLLFSIGLELSFQRLWQMRKTIFRIGPMELFGGGALIALVLLLLGNSLPTALALGLALALSSTALVLRIALYFSSRSFAFIFGLKRRPSFQRLANAPGGGQSPAPRPAR